MINMRRVLNRIEKAFWLEFCVETDELNFTVTVWGDVDRLYDVAMGLIGSGLFSGFVFRDVGCIKITAVGPYAPARGF